MFNRKPLAAWDTAVAAYLANRVMPQRPIGAASPQEQLGIGSALSIPVDREILG